MDTKSVKQVPGQVIKRMLLLAALVLPAALPGCASTLTVTLPVSTAPATTRTYSATIYTPYEPVPTTAGLTTVTITREKTSLATQTVTLNAPGGFPPGGSRSIRHTYSSATASRLETGSRTFIPDFGKVYLVVNINIQNLGYNSFPVSVSNYKITLNSQTYNAVAIEGWEKALPTTALLYGRTIEGLMVYQIPVSEAGNSFQMWFNGPSGYSISFNSAREYVPPTTTAP